MGVRVARQLFLVGLALALWSALGRAGWLELLGCYLVALVLTDLAAGLSVLPRLPARAWLALAVLLSLPGLRFAYSSRGRILEQAGLVGVTERVRDRWRLAQSPMIAPQLLSTAEPQSFFVSADAQAQTVSVELDEGVRLQGQSLGAGLFRVDFDPRRDGVPKQLEGELAVRITADASSATRTLQVVTPLPHPRWFCRSPNGELAATVSEETDELITIGVQSASALRIAVGDGPNDCTFVDNRTVAITHRHAPELWFVDVAASPAGIRKLLLDGRAPDAEQPSPNVQADVGDGARREAPALHREEASGAGDVSPLGASAVDGLSNGRALALGRLVWDVAHGEVVVTGVATPESAPGLWRVAWPALTVSSFHALPAAADQLASSDDALIVASRADASVQRWVREGGGLIARERVELGRPAAALAVASGRVFVAVTDYRPAHSPPQLGNHFVQDQLLVLDARTLALEQRVLTARRSELQTKPGDVDQGGSPLGLWPMRDGRLAVAFAGSDELWRISLPSGEPESTRFQGDFFTPHGVVELSDDTLWLASPARGALARLSPGAVEPQVIALSPSDDALQKSRPEALARRIGERGFYESTRSGISCQSCHMHADSDLAAYNLGDHRLIPTLSVRGLAGTAPYLRDGSYPRLGDLDEVAQELYRGYARPQPGRRYALQAYVESLPRAAIRRTHDAEAEQRGYAVFRRAGCERCHAPPAFTNLGQLPLAALFPRTAAGIEVKEQLDVPSLLSVAASPPYLHDGRAATLRAVITDQNPDDLHGNTRGLSDGDQSDLLTFLGSL